MSGNDLELALDKVRIDAAGLVAGVFGPDSVTWRIDREALTFLGAGRALLLQLAHPWVAAAIAEHSKTVDDPIGRFHRTFAVVFTMVFGTHDQALLAQFPQKAVERAGSEQRASGHGRVHLVEDLDARPVAVGERRQDGEGGRSERQVIERIGRCETLRSISHYLHFRM